MGLDVSHNCWSGAYSSFHRFRKALAEAANIPFDYMEGFSDEYVELTPDVIKSLSKYLSYHEIVTHKIEALPLPWLLFRADAICALLNHSDCEGDIKRKDLLPLAQRLEELAPNVTGWSNHCLQFAAGLRAAHKAGELVDFH